MDDTATLLGINLMAHNYYLGCLCTHTHTRPESIGCSLLHLLVQFMSGSFAFSSLRMIPTSSWYIVVFSNVCISWNILKIVSIAPMQTWPFLDLITRMLVGSCLFLDKLSSERCNMICTAKFKQKRKSRANKEIWN